jgi:subfamily B ATP-binding cassette protein MsbA
MSIVALLRPHSKALAIALAAVAGEGLAELLQPWPLKIVFDNVLQSEAVHHHGWLAR